MDYFLITNFQTLCSVAIKEEYWLIDFEEKNRFPNDYLAIKQESKGFMESKLLQDFPLRGKAVYLRARNADGGRRKQE